MQIHWVHPDLIPDEQRAATEKRLAVIAEGHSDLIDVRITVRATPHHRRGAQEVRIVCDARGGELVVTRERPDAAVALEEAVEAFERAVRERRLRRNDPRKQEDNVPPELGIVDRVFRDEGYGFILTDAGDQVYFHRNAVRGGLGFETLEEGQRVSLNLEPGDDGPQATVVRPPPPDAPSP